MTRLLIAEDDPTSRVLLEVLASKWGYDVCSTRDGDEAWEAYSRTDGPRLCILDRMMPGMGGLDLCSRIRQGGEPTYVILLTALGHVDQIVEGLAAGADDYVTKPFESAVLHARIRAGERVLRLQSDLSSRVRELEDALSRIRTLEGILPICMHCHKIRDDSEIWQRLESYIANRTGAVFSHGLCPCCFEEHYGDLAD